MKKIIEECAELGADSWRRLLLKQIDTIMKEISAIKWLGCQEGDV
jgi:hypothetical protein